MIDPVPAITPAERRARYAADERAWTRAMRAARLYARAERRRRFLPCSAHPAAGVDAPERNAAKRARRAPAPKHVAERPRGKRTRYPELSRATRAVPAPRLRAWRSSLSGQALTLGSYAIVKARPYTWATSKTTLDASLGVDWHGGES